MRTIHQQKTILHLAVLLPTDRNGIMGKCEHGKSMFGNCGQCLWQGNDTRAMMLSSGQKGDTYKC